MVSPVQRVVTIRLRSDLVPARVQIVRSDFANPRDFGIVDGSRRGSLVEVTWRGVGGIGSGRGRESVRDEDGMAPVVRPEVDQMAFWTMQGGCGCALSEGVLEMQMLAASGWMQDSDDRTDDELFGRTTGEER